jgi:hypothetical protein
MKMGKTDEEVEEDTNDGNYIDTMEIKKDGWGKYYSVGGQMWEDSQNKNREDE